MLSRAFHIGTHTHHTHSIFSLTHPADLPFWTQTPSDSLLCRPHSSTISSLPIIFLEKEQEETSVYNYSFIVFSIVINKLNNFSLHSNLALSKHEIRKDTALQYKLRVNSQEKYSFYVYCQFVQRLVIAKD